MFSVTEPNHRSAQILLLLVIPGQLIFLFSSHLMKGAKTMPSFLLTAAFLAASVIQVSWPLKLCSPKNIWHHSAQLLLPFSTRATAIYFFFWEFANFKAKVLFCIHFYLELLCEGFPLVTLSLVFLCTLCHYLSVPTMLVFQVFSLLCLADWMVHCLWRQRKDPDSYSIPYLTALGDLLGTALLSLVFLILWWLGDPGSLWIKHSQL